jgi:anti-sigma factor RsiW
VREDLSCQELVELVTDYLEGALSPDDHARFEAHLAGCTGCDAHLEQVRTTIALVRASGELPSERPEMAALLAAFRGRRRTRR